MVPDWFSSAMIRMFDLYCVTPSQTMIVSWWQYLRQYGEPTIKAALERAVRDSEQRMPTAPMVAAHARAMMPKKGLVKNG